MRHYLITLLLCLATSLSYATPRQLITHNDTAYQSNAFLGAGLNMPSPKPTAANSTNQVFWGIVQVICGKRTGSCDALIKMKTDTSNPVNIGKLTLNLDTGDITPKVLSHNGFTVTVLGVGETRITEDKN